MSCAGGNGWAMPLENLRLFADFTGADPRGRGDKFSPTELARQRAELEEAGDWEVKREGEGLIAERKDGQRVCGFWPAPGEKND